MIPHRINGPDMRVTRIEPTTRKAFRSILAEAAALIIEGMSESPAEEEPDLDEIARDAVEGRAPHERSQAPRFNPGE